MRKLILLLLINFLVMMPHISDSQTLSFLALGDSYTIGEAVPEADRFPMQTVELLKKKNIHFSEPRIIARTGWTTYELLSAIHDARITNTYNVVTLLIGVNNQYRGLSRESYRKEFVTLLEFAIHLAGQNAAHVFVLSIPDWGVTPFAHGKNKDQIAQDIDAFNAINNQETDKQHCHYIDITPISRLAANDESLIAADGLHPSGKMYSKWAELLAKEIEKEFKH